MSVKAQPGDKVVLAYSGGLDTSIILKWLTNKGFEVICYCANVGQQGEDYEKVRAKALSLGAKKVYIEDLREDFVKDYIFEAVKSNAIYESRYLLGTSLARPVIAKKQVEIAQAEGAKYVAHGATGKGNDQVRFELCAQALDAHLKTIAPWRDAEFIEKFKGRADLIQYAKEQNIPIDATPKAPYSVDENLYHTSYEAGMLEDPMTAPMVEMFKMTVDPKDAPDAAEQIQIRFEKGIPVGVTNLTAKTPELTGALDLFLELNKLAGKHGIGRIDIVENRFVGIKSRGCYETPGGTILRHAHLDLEGMCMDREVMKVRDSLSAKFAEFCYNGFWFAPEMDFVRNAVDFSQQNVTGYVNLELYKGNVTVIGRFSDEALYSADLASMDQEGGGANFDYNPADAQGFIRINATRLKAWRCRPQPKKRSGLYFKKQHSMGNDGGVIAVKRKFMRHANVKARGEKADQEALRLEKARTCALSSEPLREPVVACRLGNLFNKQTLLEHLLAKSMPERFRHITSLKDVVTCRVMREKEQEDALWCCPVTMAEFNGKQPFVVLFSCGCVLSERALKAVNTKECLVCGKPFEEKDVVTLLLNDEQYESRQQRLLELKAEEKLAKKNKKKAKEEKVEGKHKHKEKKSKRKAENIGETGDARLVKIAKTASESISKAKEKSQVFASIFSKEKKEKASANDLLMTIGGMRYTLS